MPFVNFHQISLNSCFMWLICDAEEAGDGDPCGDFVEESGRGVVVVVVVLGCRERCIPLRRRSSPIQIGGS